MKLRSVEMVGFKSFRDRVMVDVSGGVTCIVGPNGCGKSNVVDAIKWAMGEMSPKSLRGESLSDVIFAGTEKRKPAGMAEVTLTFDTSEPEDAQMSLEDIDDGFDPTDSTEAEEEGEESGENEEGEARQGDEQGDELDLGRSIPRQFQNLSEIAITRRLHRSGDSEYLINKVPCRLRDIRNLLAGTGLGKQGYSIIEQGQIGFIVNARPAERRLIIEEASGITRYKDRRKRAARKLDRTEDNLRRTRDILDEIEKRMDTLEEQADKARVHKEVSEKLQALEVALLVDRRAEAAQTATKLEEKLKRGKKKADERVEKREEAEKNLKVARKKSEDAEKRHTDLTENYYKLETRLNLAKSNREHAIETRDRAAKRREELIDERRRQKERRKHLAGELERVRQALESVDENPEEVKQAVEALEQQLKALQSERDEVVSNREEARRAVARKRAKVSRIDDRLEWIDEQVGEFDERRESLSEELASVQLQRRQLARRIDEISEDHEAAVDEIGECQQAFEEVSEKLETSREALQEARRREEELARRKMELDTRIDSLEQMRRRGEGYEEGVRLVLEWARQEGRDDILGAAGDFLQVPEGLEAAYGAFIGDRLGDILVAHRQAAMDALAVLQREDAGRIGCFPVDEDSTPQQVVQRWVEGLKVVDSLDEVPTKERNGDVEGWATPQGDVIFADGRVVGGATGDQAETVLRQVRQLEQLREQLETTEAAHRRSEEELQKQLGHTETLEEQVEEAREQLREARHRARQLQQDVNSERREKQRVQTREQRLKDQQSEIEQRFQQLAEEREERGEQRQMLEEEIPGRQESIDKLDGRVEKLEQRIEKVDGELTEKKIRVAKVDERRRHLEETLKRLEKDQTQTIQRLERMERDIGEQKARGKEAKMRAETLASQIEQLESDYAKLGTEVENVEEVVKELSQRVETLELTVLSRRKEEEEAKEKVQKLQMKLHEAKLEVEHATEQLGERFEIDLAEARRRSAKVEIKPEERKKRAKALKRKLRRLGEVNPLAIQEFEEAKERHEFHFEQQADLEESVADLRAAIERMDRESRKRFRSTFEAVNEKFQEVFPRLFRGGHARLLLTEPDNILETGVDIEVQPPGKKLQNVTLLSGGEKALTAVSLIFAIFMLKPSPFAILDEVDAPLDDANVGRFAEMIKELSERSQMIVITHNRRTMEMPDLLYGVTMEEAGVSKLVSVELSDVDDRMAS